MGQKGLTSILVVIGLVIILGIGFAGFSRLRKIGPVPISWEETKRLVKNCQVQTISQTHSQEVNLTLKDGSSRRTLEPTLDDIFYLASEAEKSCGFEIVTATE